MFAGGLVKKSVFFTMMCQTFLRDKNAFENGSDLAFCRKLSGNIALLMHRGAYANDSRWIRLIPVYHLLNSLCREKCGHDHKTQKWWGTEGFDSDVQTHKAFSKTYV